MVIGPGDFELSMDELRVVARYAVESAQEVLPLFEKSHPDDRRPRAAVAAAWTFVDGANRTKLQRIAALDAHRAAKDATIGEPGAWTARLVELETLVENRELAESVPGTHRQHLAGRTIDGARGPSTVRCLFRTDAGP